MSRDFAAEHQADLVAAELAALRELRDAALRMGRLLQRAHLTGNLGLLARKAKSLEVTP